MRSFLIWIAFSPVVVGASGPLAQSSHDPTTHRPDSLYHFSRPAMGTDVQIYLHATSGERATELFQAAFSEIEAAEAALSLHRTTSEVARINRTAGTEPVTTDPETFDLLQRALAWSERTGGAFDITVAPLVRVWGFLQGEGGSPAPEDLSAARSRSGWEKVALDEAGRSVRFLTPGVELDLGGIGKGWALDRAARTLRNLGVEAALLGLGQSTYVAIGTPPGAEGWAVSISDPRLKDETISTIQLRDQALSTSGSTERYFVEDGRRLSHIIDPRTGRPSEGVAQATVTAPTATGSDALSTALFVMGPEAAREFLEAHQDLRALVVLDRAGDGRVIRLDWPESSPNRNQESEWPQ